MKNHSIIGNQIKFFDGCTQALKESAEKCWYKDTISSYLPTGTRFGAFINFQQAVINNRLMYGAANSEACATFLRSVAEGVQGTTQDQVSTQE